MDAICDLIHFFSSPWASVTKLFVDVPLFLLMLDWNSAWLSNRSMKKVIIDWSPPLVGLVMLNSDGCYFGNLGQMGIDGVIRDHSSIELRVFFKQTRLGLAIKAEIFSQCHSIICPM